jgi:hypothetical protein
MDVAIVYFGLTRSTKKVYQSHIRHIYQVLDKYQLTYKKFMHTWSMKDGIQNIADHILPQRIDYDEYKLLSPDVYKIDSEEEFLSSVDMDQYFYKDVWDKKGHCMEGEWIPRMVSNHICMLESQRRATHMIDEYIQQTGNTPKSVLFIRPDVECYNDLPLEHVVFDRHTINLPDHSHHEGLNDQVALIHYDFLEHYGKRINELAEFRKHNGRIVGEKYIKFIIHKYNKKVHMIPFQYSIVRPS